MYHKEIRINSQVRQTTKNDELTTIYLRIFTDWGGRKKDFVISARQTVPIKQWDDVKKKVKGNSDEARRINRTIDQYIQRIRELSDNYKLTAQTLSASAFKALVLQELFGVNSNQVDDRLYLPDLFDRYLYVKGDKISPEVKSKYILAKNRVIDFTMKEHGTDKFELNRLNTEWYLLFERYLNTEIKGIKSTNTITSNLKKIRTIVNYAMSIDLIEKYPFKNCKLKFEETPIKYLNGNDFEKLLKYKSNNPHTQIVADCFLFAILTGLSHSDLRNLREDMIFEEGQNKIIKKQREKTDVGSIIYLCELALGILDKYKEHPKSKENNKVLPVPYINSYNQHLKIIAAECGIKMNLSSHVARHTFATTIWLENGGSKEALQRILGHADSKTTAIYGKITAKRITEESNQVFNMSLRGMITPDKINILSKTI